MKKKVLVMYARYGSGHKAIAEYVANYLKENNDKVEVMILDLTDYSNTFGKIGLKVFDWVATKRKEFLFDLGYELTDHKIASLGHNTMSKRSYDNKELRRIICDFNPNVVISSHFYCSNIINYYNKINLIDAKLFTIITDYSPHEWWIRNHKKETGYIVGNEIVKEELVHRGVDAKKVYPFGLPLNISQIENLDSEEDILRRYNLKNNRKKYLFFGGSTAGSLYYYDYLKTLIKLNIDADKTAIMRQTADPTGNGYMLEISCEQRELLCLAIAICLNSISTIQQPKIAFQN